MGGPALDPVSNILYVNANEMAWIGGLVLTAKASSPGEAIYQRQCAVCHGIDRAGAPPAFPSLVEVGKRLPIEKITSAIRQGVGRMPSFPNIDEQRMATLLDYLRNAASAPERELVASPQNQKAPASGENAAGAEIYRDNCAACHGDKMEGIPPSFPTLVGLGTRMTSAQLSKLIHAGKGNMPAQPEIEGSKLEALLQYLKVEPGSPQADPAGDFIPDRYTFTGYRKFLDPDGYPAIAPPWGTFSAIDLKTGKYLWRIPLGEYPDLVATGMKNTGSENYGGPVVTAGGVVFIGATVYDRKFRAFDNRTGQLLWETLLPFAGVATPSTYMLDGKQYVVIAASGGRDPKGPTGGMYVAFALPDGK